MSESTKTYKDTDTIYESTYYEGGSDDMAVTTGSMYYHNRDNLIKYFLKEEVEYFIDENNKLYQLKEDKSGYELSSDDPEDEFYSADGVFLEVDYIVARKLGDLFND